MGFERCLLLRLRLLLRDWLRLRMPGVVGADFCAMYDVRGVWAVGSSGEGGALASRGYLALRGARERLCRFG
jgi:hypothetical protein